MKRTQTAHELMAAIHRKCLDCSGGMRKEVANCQVEGCALWPYRFGEDNRRACAKIEGQIGIFDAMDER